MSSSWLYSESIKTPDPLFVCIVNKLKCKLNYHQFFFKCSCTANQSAFKSSFAKIKVNNKEISAMHPFDIEFLTLKNIFISSAIDFQTSGD